MRSLKRANFRWMLSEYPNDLYLRELGQPIFAENVQLKAANYHQNGGKEFDFISVPGKGVEGYKNQYCFRAPLKVWPSKKPSTASGSEKNLSEDLKDHMLGIM